MTCERPATPRVVFVNRFYAPDESASSQMLTDLTVALARAGHEVLVVCGRQLYGDPRAGLPRRERLRGVTVRRVPATRFGRDRLPGRALDYLTFYLSVTLYLLALVGRGDILVVKTDPPLLSLPGWLVARLNGAHLVNWLQDIFPELASRLSLSPLPPPLEGLLRAARDRSLANARVNIVLGERMRAYLIRRGIAAQRIQICENWADERRLRPLAPSRSRLRARLGLGERFVAAYSGNLGRAHDMSTILEAAERCASEPDVVFLMIGGGVNMRALASQARARNLSALHFEPYQPRDALCDSLAAGDVHLVSLRPELEGLVVPSKVYGILAAGRPIVFIGDPDGELAQMIGSAGVGLAVRIGDGAGLYRALCALRDDAPERTRMGARARSLFEQRYTLESAVARWRKMLAAVGS